MYFVPYLKLYMNQTNFYDLSEIAKDKYIPILFVCINIRVDGKVSCEGYSSCDS